MYGVGQRIVGILLLALLAAVLFMPTNGMSAEFPALSGRVVDEAGILSASNKAVLNKTLADEELRSGNQVVVAVVQNMRGMDVDTYTNALFKQWKLGQATRNNGVLFLVAVQEKKLRIEVGYGLEYAIPDVVASRIIRNQVIPKLRMRDWDGGVKVGVDGILTELKRGR